MKAKEALRLAMLSSNDQLNTCIKLIIEAAMDGRTEKSFIHLKGGTIHKLEEYGYSISIKYETSSSKIYNVSWNLSHIV